MKHERKDIEGSRREFLVEISPEEVSEKLGRIYDQIGRTADMPGFRKGRVPRDLLEKHYGEAARERMLTDLVNDSYIKVIEESGTMTVGLPHITDVKLGQQNEMSYKATVDIRPNIALKRYKGIKVKKKKTDVKDNEIEKYISVLRESYAEFRNVEERAARKGDYLVCDVTCEVEGKAIYKDQKNVSIILDDTFPLPDVVKGLSGSAKGDTRLVKTKLPENAQNKEHSNKEAIFTIKVNSIKEKKLPELDDEFIKGLGNCKDLRELKEAIEKDLLLKKENMVKDDLVDQILEQLLKETPFGAPQSLVDKEAERLLKEAKEDMAKRNVANVDIEKKDAELRRAMQDRAAKKVKIFFLLDEIATLENIDVSAGEIESALEELANQSGASKEDVKGYYEKNNLLSYLKTQLRDNKTIDFLLDSADIKEER